MVPSAKQQQAILRLQEIFGKSQNILGSIKVGQQGKNAFLILNQL